MQTARYSLILLFFALAVPSLADAAGRKDFTTYGPSVAGAGYGDAATAYCNDLTAYHYNPALLSSFVQETLTASHFILFDETRYNFFALGYPLGYGFFGLAAAVMSSGPIEARETIEEAPSVIHTQQYAIDMSFGTVIDLLALNVGMNIKYLDFDLAGYRAGALGLDLGFSKTFKWTEPRNQAPAILFGLNIRNLYQPKLKFLADEETYPISIAFGTAVKIPLFMRYNPASQVFSFDRLVLATDLDYNTDDNELSIRPGIEYGLFNRYFVRAGYRENVTFGIGYHSDSFQFDYALDPKPYNKMHKVGFTYYWGEPKEVPESEDFEKYRKARLEAERLYGRQLKISQELTERKQYNEALNILKYTFFLNPESSKAKELHRQIKDLKTAHYLQEQNSIINSKLSENKRLEAYRTALETLSNAVYDYDTRQKAVKIYNDMLTGSDPSVVSAARQIRQDYIDEIGAGIAQAVAVYDFEKAGTELQKLIAIEPDSYYTFDKTKLVEDSKRNHIAKCIIDIEDAFKGKRYEEAFIKACEGLIADPSNAPLRALKQKAGREILSQKNYSTNERLYIDRMYYLAARNMANNEKYEARDNIYTLIRFNPVHENGRILYYFMKKEGVIK